MDAKVNYRCFLCGSELEVDDIEINFKGNENHYCYCPKCNVSVYAQIRFGQLFTIEFLKEDKQILFKKFNISRSV